MSERARHAGQTGRFLLPSGQIIPIADWEFAITREHAYRVVIRGRFTAPEAIAPARAQGRAAVILEEDDSAGGVWRGGVALEVNGTGAGAVWFRARHELLRGGRRA